MRSGKIFLFPFILLLLESCSEETAGPELSITPVLGVVNVSSNPNNVVSAVVTAVCSNTSSAFVEYGTGAVFDRLTPSFPVKDNSVLIPVAGLKPNTLYKMRVALRSLSGEVAKSSPFEYTTGTLPEDIVPYSVVINESPAGGYVMLGFNGIGLTFSYAIIIENSGEIVWYRRFDGSIVDFQKQPGGTYTVYSAFDDIPLHFYELDVLGNIIAQYSASNNFETGPHEIRLTGNGHALFGVEFRTMDLTQYGGLPDATVRGLTVEYHRPGFLPFFWNTFDYLSVTEAAPDIPLTGQFVNPWHGNAIDIDSDGHLLVSFRNSDAVIKINSQDGGILWRLGGRLSQFTVLGDQFNGFSHQHGIRRLQNGNVILFDNGNLHNPQVSRAVEYNLDEQQMTATLIWQYIPFPPLYSSALGFAQRLYNGNTLVCFGTAQRVVEVDMSGVKKWELSIDEPLRYTYRAFRISSLY